MANSYLSPLQFLRKDIGALEKGSLRIDAAAMFYQFLLLLVQIIHIRKDVFAAHKRHVFRLRAVDNIMHTSVSVQSRRQWLKLPLLPVWVRFIN